MPKSAEYQVMWSEKQRAYVLLHAPSSFLLTDDGLQTWLTLMDTFHFQAVSGESLTVRKETKQRGTAYWYAYRRVNGKLRKKYMGDACKVTLVLLEAIARAFIAPPEPEPSPRQEPQPPPRVPVFHFTNTLKSALTIFGLSSVPTKMVLLSKYRVLVKQHHPDKGGLHRDMVAINLAYDLLKRWMS
ncbi:MAG: J domain-containing protein [Ktedonobacteraceae bacterium]